MRRERKASTLLVALGLPVLLLTASPRAVRASSPRCSLSSSGFAMYDSDGNGILEPGEAARIAPSWSALGIGLGGNRIGCPVPILNGTASVAGNALAGRFKIEDDHAQYSLPAVIPTVCFDCYRVSIAATGLPRGHRDMRFDEHVSGRALVPIPPLSASKSWTLHIGDSFTDTPRTSPFYEKVETLLHHGITAGCSPTEFCPMQAVSRAQIAIFVARALAGSSAIPLVGGVEGHAYSCTAGGTSLFVDVSPTDVICKHVHFLAAKNIGVGCGPGLYCPADTLTRLDMATFVADAIAHKVPVAYGPDPVTASPTTAIRRTRGLISSTFRPPIRIART